MTTTLVTGATGFIGSHLVRSLNRRGIRPRVLVRATSNRSNLDDLEAEIIQGDLLDPSSLRRALDGCQQVYHVAGYVSSRPGDRRRLFDSNTQGTISIMDAAHEVGVSRITYLGSVTALGASEEPRIFEETMPYNLGNAGSAYFESKRAAELAVKDRIEAGLPVVSVYPAYCLGPGDIYLSSSLMVTEFVKGRLPFVTKAGMGFLDGRDAAEALVLAMEKGRVGERYFTSGHNLTYQQFFSLLGEVSGRRPPRLVLPKPILYALCAIGEPLTDGEIFSRTFYIAMARYHWYDNSKAQEELGWSFRPLEETLRDSIAWLEKAGYLA